MMTTAGGSRRRSFPPDTVSAGASAAFKSLCGACEDYLQGSWLAGHVQNVHFKPSPSGKAVFFPCPLKELEAVAALKALEACLAAAIADQRYGREQRHIEVDMDRAACFLMSAYLCTVDGMEKGHPGVQRKLPGETRRPRLAVGPADAELTRDGRRNLADSDFNKAQSVLYRRLSANLYETKTPGEYYHIHGSLEASTTLAMVNLPPFNADLTEYRECIDTIEEAVKKYTVAELEAMNARDGRPAFPPSPGTSSAAARTARRSQSSRPSP